jgi:hypothetical protein
MTKTVTPETAFKVNWIFTHSFKGMKIEGEVYAL